MFAPFAHHLGAPRVPFNGNPAHRARLDVPVELVKVDHGVVDRQRRRPVQTPLYQILPVLGARFALMPIRGAQRAKLLITRRARHRLGPDRALAHVANGSAIRSRAPGAVLVQGHLGVESEGLVFVRHFLPDDGFYFGLLQNALFVAFGVWTSDVVGPLHDLEAHVLVHALLAEQTAAFVQRDHLLDGRVVQANLAQVLLGVLHGDLTGVGPHQGHLTGGPAVEERRASAAHHGRTAAGRPQPVYGPDAPERRRVAKVVGAQSESVVVISDRGRRRGRLFGHSRHLVVGQPLEETQRSG